MLIRSKFEDEEDDVNEVQEKLNVRCTMMCNITQFLLRKIFFLNFLEVSLSNTILKFISPSISVLNWSLAHLKTDIDIPLLYQARY